MSFRRRVTDGADAPSPLAVADAPGTSFAADESRVIIRLGFGAVTTNAIAAEAGAAIGTVYDYFPNKEALLGALLERYQARMFTRAERVTLTLAYVRAATEPTTIRKRVRPRGAGGA